MPGAVGARGVVCSVSPAIIQVLGLFACVRLVIVYHSRTRDRQQSTKEERNPSPSIPPLCVIQQHVAGLTGPPCLPSSVIKSI